MTTIKEITTDTDFQTHTSTLSSQTLLCIAFHTPWAAPCAQMTSILTALAANYPAADPRTVSFISLNAESLPDISESYDVTAVPFLVLQRDGKILESVSGSDASKIRGAVERWVGKPGGEGNKTALPEALTATPRVVPHEPQATTNGSSGTKDLSNYAPRSSDPATAPAMSSTQTSTEELNARLAELVKAAPVMLFMKGTPSAPQCGFSRQLVGLLREQGVRYGFFNILADEDVRQGLKVWADWPTFPQLWVGGELVGGLDIVSPFDTSLCSMQWLNTIQVKEELESDPEFFKDYAVAKGKGGMAAPDSQPRPETTTA